MKKVLSTVLVVAMMLSTLSVGVLAADAEQITISTAAELSSFAESVNNGDSYEGKTVTLTSDIDLSGVTDWSPIGNGTRSSATYSGNAFKGIFDGGNYTISNLKITSGEASAAIGLFGVVDGGTVKNLTLTDVNINASENKNAGAVIGLMVNGATADKLTVSGSVSAVDGVGGIIGRMTIKGAISNSVNNATVSATGSGGAGGIVGKAYYTVTDKEMTISNCKNTGVITSGYAAGGIAGLSAANVSGCTNTAKISAGTEAGGIIGEQVNYGEVAGNTNTGDVSNNGGGTAYGGIIGWVRYQTSASDYSNNEAISVTGNTNEGDVNASGASLGAGGIVGTVYNQAAVTSNTNKAEKISSGTFASGVVGTIQESSDNLVIDGKYVIANNISTTVSENITANCTNLYVYDNFSGRNENVVIVGNTDNIAIEVTAPDMSGNTINVTAANAQLTLDGAYGDITGKTINFTEDITSVLDLARPTKYKGSETTYYNYVDYELETEVTEWSEEISSVMNSHSHYYRTLKNVTFTADEGVGVAGFTFSAGHVASSGYDYVRDVELTSGVTYYKHSSLDNISFNGLTVTGNFSASLYLEGCTVSGVTFDSCVFAGTTDDGANAAIKFLADNQYFTNVIVKNCEIDGYKQGVYISGIDGAYITNNNISNTEHNAIALQSCDESNPAKGTVVVEENYITNVSDRAIRLNYVADANIKINNNIMVDCGDDEGQLIKATSVEDEATVDLESNYWDGEEPSTAIVGIVEPATVGITGGIWENISFDTLAIYSADGYEAVLNADGAYEVDIETDVPATATAAKKADGTASVAINAGFDKWNDESVTVKSYGMYIYKQDTKLGKKVLVDATEGSLESAEGLFNVVIKNVPETEFNTVLVCLPYVIDSNDNMTVGNAKAITAGSLLNID